MSSIVYCGKCKNKYATRQNWANPFALQKVNSQKPGVTSRLPNICYNTNDPRVCDGDLDKAVNNYHQELKQRKVLQVFLSPNIPSSSCRSLPCHSSTKEQTPASKKRKIETSNHSDNNNNDILIFKSNDDSGKQFSKNKTSTSSSDLKDTQVTVPTITTEEHSKIDIIKKSSQPYLKRLVSIMNS